MVTVPCKYRFPGTNFAIFCLLIYDSVILFLHVCVCMCAHLCECEHSCACLCFPSVVQVLGFQSCTSRPALSTCRSQRTNSSASPCLPQCLPLHTAGQLTCGIRGILCICLPSLIRGMGITGAVLPLLD